MNMQVRPRSAALIRFDDMSEDALIRQAQLISAVIPVGRTTLWRMVKEKRFPEPRKLPGHHVTYWRVGDVRAWLKEHHHGQ